MIRKALVVALALAALASGVLSACAWHTSRSFAYFEFKSGTYGLNAAAAWGNLRLHYTRCTGRNCHGANHERSCWCRVCPSPRKLMSRMDWQARGFWGCLYVRSSLALRTYSLETPWWLLAVLSGLCGIYPAVAFFRGPVRRWRRRKRGLCVHCGYNLTGLTEPRCPECGEKL